MKITVLTYLDSKNENSKDYEAVVPQVAKALRSLGHRVSILGSHGNVKRLTAGLSRRKPDLVFNLMEMFGENIFGDIPVAGLLDLCGLKYTGSGPGELYLSQDKGLTKKLLAFEDILYPRFLVFSRGEAFETGGNLRMPLFVKPLRSDSSLGIGGKSLVHDAVALMERVAYIRKELNDSALAEEYIEGREFFVGVLGNTQAKALPPVEVDFTGFPEGVPKVLDSKAKWDVRSKEYKGTKSVLANLPDELRARLQKVAVDAYRALRVRDYGRVDIRLTDTGDIYVLEVNASCYLERSSEFAMSAAAAGMDYPTLIERIVQLALERNGK
ncbi:MAG: D-alanine-D-alanine ligase [Gemmatimonadales bacterium]|jgi:D-alanine-D-alanine ligase|nr:D-alanine-D-alanine ligase [Gemmatimonadales bacterium]